MKSKLVKNWTSKKVEAKVKEYFEKIKNDIKSDDKSIRNDSDKSQTD